VLERCVVCVLYTMVYTCVLSVMILKKIRGEYR